MYNTLLVIISLVLSVPLFIFFNSIMDITYLGCGGIVTFWFVCFFIGGILATIILGIFSGILGLLKWIIIIGIILAIISFIADKVRNNE